MHEWTHSQDEVRAEVSEGGETRQSTCSRVSETGVDTSHQPWKPKGQYADSGFLRQQMSWQDQSMIYATDREWHVSKKWHAAGWASDPSQWSQYPKRAKPTHADPAKPTHADPSDDQRSAAPMPSGATTKTWKPGLDRQFWSNTYGQPTGGASSSARAAGVAPKNYQVDLKI